jgi:hypothetical protein
MEKASAKYDIPFRTIANEIKKCHQQRPRPPVFFLFGRRRADFRFVLKKTDNIVDYIYFFPLGLRLLKCTSTFVNLTDFLLYVYLFHLFISLIFLLFKGS